MKLPFPLLRAVAAALLLCAPAFAQRPVMVFGGGIARECFEIVKEDRLFAARALEICSSALEQEDLSRSNRAATHINRGILYMRQQSHGRAAQDFDAALRLSPDMAEARINLGAMYYYLGDYAKSVEALNQGVQVKDVEARAAAYYNRGLAHERLGNIEGAYADYREALAVQPEFELAAKQLKRFTLISATP